MFETTAIKNAIALILRCAVFCYALYLHTVHCLCNHTRRDDIIHPSVGVKNAKSFVSGCVGEAGGH